MSLAVAAGMILIAAFLLRSEWEKLQLDKTFLRLKTKKPLGYPPDAESTDEKLRLLFISDLHEYALVMHRLDEVMAKIRAEKPDAVLVGGDMLTVSRRKVMQQPDTAAALCLLKALAAEYPVYYGEGNHEVRLKGRNPQLYDAYVEKLRSYGVQYLADNSARLCIAGTDTGVMVHGISLEEEFYVPDPGIGLDLKLPEGYLSRKLPAFDTAQYNVLLLHEPAFLKEAAQFGADLILSGHMHGGTIRLPDGSGLMSPQYRFFVKECSGTFQEKDTVMAVGRGLGTHSIKIRFNDLPELMFIDLVDNENSTDKL